MDLEKKIYKFKMFIGKEEFRVLMDVAHCNLKCAMCPRGGVLGLKNEIRGLMSFKLFKDIIDKFVREKVKIRQLDIGNWGEPLLNPELPKMIEYVKDNWAPVFIGKKGSIKLSTNLNYLKDPDELLESGVDLIRVSVSGMSQKIYSKNHVGGDIGVVLRNISRLVDAKRKRNADSCIIEMAYHDLVYNKDDAETARKFCDSHGINFIHLDMFISCVEENVVFHRDKERFSGFYREFIDLDREIGRMKTVKDIKKCQVRRGIVTIFFTGQLCRCCGVFEEKNLMRPIFDYKIREIPNIPSGICDICAKTPMSWREG